VSAPAPRSERLLPTERLRTTADYQRCYRDGARRHGALAVVYWRANAEGHPRLGTAVSRKVGGAVVRNRMKRWTRDCFRRSALRPRLPALDLVVQPKPAAAAASYAAYCRELARLVAPLAREGAR
jgi:ribonuclease P protein component